MSINIVIAADRTITEMYEEIFPSSFILKSRIFNKLQKKRGGNWDKK
jgi:hypothetical protein